MCIYFKCLLLTYFNKIKCLVLIINLIIHILTFFCKMFYIFIYISKLYYILILFLMYLFILYLFIL